MLQRMWGTRFMQKVLKELLYRNEEKEVAEVYVRVNSPSSNSYIYKLQVLPRSQWDKGIEIYYSSFHDLISFYRKLLGNKRWFLDIIHYCEFVIYKILERLFFHFLPGF